MEVLDSIERFRQPEYTGENRCLPCTAVNAVLAAVLALAVAVLLGTRLGWVAGILAGTVVLVLSAGSIYLRGYLVPGTPWLTKTYFPDWLLRRFEKEPETESPVDDDLDVESVLLRVGAVAPCENADDLCLTDGFRAAWNDRIEAVRTEETSRAELAAMLDADPDRLTVEDYGEAFLARLGDTRVGQWESRAAFLADVAAATVLRERFDGWSDLDIQQRSQVLYGLRVFLEQCPTCAGTVAVDEETVESCCRSIDIIAVSCQDCNARMLEVERPGEGGAPVA